MNSHFCRKPVNSLIFEAVMYERKLLPNITEQLYQGRVIIIHGARRVGKTTLSKQILAREKERKAAYFNAELLPVFQSFSTTDPILLKQAIGDANLIVIDGAQHIPNMGLSLKILVDTYPEIQIIATGSCSFDLANKAGEPLVGRARYFHLNPLAISEISDSYVEQLSLIEQMMIYGGYPTVLGLGAARDAILELDTLVGCYLYKDILAFENLKHSDRLVNLLQLLAFQIGSEVSYNELGTTLGMDRHTVMRYIDLLEKCFVIFRLGALSKNKRKEISKNNKIYFYDLGIRNSLIRNFNGLKLRSDLGGLWENFCILERLKRNTFAGHRPNTYFWRHYGGQEVDYVEEYGGAFHGYEFKYNAKAKTKNHIFFAESYSDTIEVINSQNILSDFLAFPPS
jgi:predicted AAA+ superfamily ATPase